MSFSDGTPTRRLMLLGLVAASSAGACSRPTSGAGTPERQTDDELVQDLVDQSSSPKLLKRDAPYRLTRPVRLRGGTTLTIEPLVRLDFDATRLPAGQLIGVFEAHGDDVAIRVEDGEATVQCSPASAFIYAASAERVNGFTVIGLRAVDCHHVRVDGGAPGASYNGVVTHGVEANVASRVHIERGGARFATQPLEGHASCLLRYVFDWSVADCQYETTTSGVEWWGGDANPVTGNGAATNERKCGRFTITGVSAKDTRISGIWGSMGTNGTVTNCEVADCGDVGFDSEGSTAIAFHDCHARDAANGAFGTFFLNHGVRFINCHAVVTRRTLPVFRVHNPTLAMSENRHIVISGGRWECTDPQGPSSIDTRGGPCAELTIEDAVMVNVCIDTAHIGVHETRIIGNDLSFSAPIGASPAIRAGGSKTLGSPIGGTVTVGDNTIRLTASSDAPALAIFEDDTISSATAKIIDNRITGPFPAAIRVINASPNPAVHPACVLSGNVIDLPAEARVVEVVSQSPATSRPSVTWRDGRRAGGAALTAAEAITRR